jgi:hypothetical protein
MDILKKIENFLNEQDNKEEKKDKVVTTIVSDAAAAQALSVILEKLKNFIEEIQITLNSNDADDAETVVYSGVIQYFNQDTDTGNDEEKENDDMETEEDETDDVEVD